MFEDIQLPIGVAEHNLAVDDHRRAPDAGHHVMLPVSLTGLDVEAVEEAAQIGGVEQAVGDRDIRYGSAKVLATHVPDAAGLGYVSGLRGIDRVEVSRPFA